MSVLRSVDNMYQLDNLSRSQFYKSLPNSIHTLPKVSYSYEWVIVFYISLSPTLKYSYSIIIKYIILLFIMCFEDDWIMGKHICCPSTNQYTASTRRTDTICLTVNVTLTSSEQIGRTLDL